MGHDIRGKGASADREFGFKTSVYQRASLPRWGERLGYLNRRPSLASLFPGFQTAIGEPYISRCFCLDITAPMSSIGDSRVEDTRSDRIRHTVQRDEDFRWIYS